MAFVVQGMSFEAQAVIDNMSRLEINTTGTTNRAKLRRSLFMPEVEENSNAACADGVDIQLALASRDRGTDSQVRQRLQTFAHTHRLHVINSNHGTSFVYVRLEEV